MKRRQWTAAQRQALEREMARTRDAALYRRLLALSLIDQGHPVTQVAQWLRVDRRTVHRWIGRFAQSGTPAMLAQQPGQGRPAQWEPALDRLLQAAF